jgi:hypothetical protein
LDNRKLWEQLSNFVLLQDFFIELLFGGQYRFEKVSAVNPVSGNKLHTAAWLAVVQQKAVTVHAVAAFSAGKFSDLCRLFRREFQNHTHHLLRSEIRATKKPPVSRRLIAPHLYNTEERRFCFRQSNRRKFTNATRQKHCNSRTFVLYSTKSQSEKQRLRETFSKFSQIFLQIFYCPFYGT